jgi:hypothetical protein
LDFEVARWPAARVRAGGFAGKRLFLTKTRAEQDSELFHSIRRKEYSGDEKEPKFLVIFQIDKVLPLIGDGGIG